MNGWPLCSLASVASVFNGKTPSRADQRNEGHPVLKIKDVSAEGEFRGKFESFIEASFSSRYANKLLRAGDSLILNAAHNASYVASKKYFAEPEALGSLITGEWLVIRPFSSAMDPRFVYHWLSLPKTQTDLRELVNGIHLYPKDVALLRIPTPVLAQQRRIVEVLDQAQELIKKRRRATVLIDDLAQSIFLEMFGNPIRNERSWPVGTVSSFVKGFESGKSLAEGEDEHASRFRILKISAVTSGRFLARESKPAPEGYVPPLAHIVHGGDLLFSRANTSELIGATAFVSGGTENMLMPDKLWRFVWNDEVKPSPWFVHYLFKQYSMREIISKNSSGSSGSMKNISQGKVLSIKLGIPPVKLQREFEERILMAVSYTHLTLPTILRV